VAKIGLKRIQTFSMSKFLLEAILAMSSTAMAKGRQTMSIVLKTGQKAPDFSLFRDGGTKVSLADFSGTKLVIFFYPRDNTPGCTKQAKAFSVLKEDFLDANTEILGMSADTVRKHDNFVKKQGLLVPLAADPDLDVLKSYGVWRKKSMYGRTYMGIVRTTTLINESGEILRIWDKVKVDKHAQEVLEAAKLS
jgi:peroxiredoxin Q/BCP